VPTVPGWRVEVFARPGLGSAGISLRMVPSSHPPGAPHPNDRLREALRLALAAPAWSGEGVGAEEVSGDPIAALLAAALRLRSGLPAEAWVDAAAAVLGDDDADVRLLRGATTLSSPAMLFFGWQHRLERGELAVVPGSSADAITGRQRIAAPWLTWNLDPKESASAWLANVAQSVWPGWDVAPNPQVAVADLAVAACALCAPAESVRALTYKSPPVDRLVQHQRIAFVGATNDQLPAALAVAFVERGKRRWPRLEIWSLEDRLLHSVVSHGETGEALLARRDRAEEQLSALLAVVADESSLERYDGFEVDGAWHFASLWDWEAPGGYVHTSAYYGRGQELRIAPAENLEWTSSEPPPGYAKASTAYTALRARHPSRGHR
jgi:hypothetical protein